MACKHGWKEEAQKASTLVLDCAAYTDVGRSSSQILKTLDGTSCENMRLLCVARCRKLRSIMTAMDICKPPGALARMWKGVIRVHSPCLGYWLSYGTNEWSSRAKKPTVEFFQAWKTFQFSVDTRMSNRPSGSWFAEGSGLWENSGYSNLWEQKCPGCNRLLARNFQQSVRTALLDDLDMLPTLL